MKAKQSNIQTEEQILRAANKVFHAKGKEGARMQEIADEANVNVSLLYYYYRSKRQLFEAVFNQTFSLFTHAINRIFNGDSSIEEKIREFTDSYSSLLLGRPYLANFIVQEISRSPDYIDSLKANPKFLNFKKFNTQLVEEIRQGNIIPISGEQLFINIISLNVLPFMTGPLFEGYLNYDHRSFHELLEIRKTEVADFIINSIKHK